MIYPHVVRKSCQAKISSVERINQERKLHPYVEVAMLSMSGSTCLFYLAAGMSMASLAFFGSCLDVAIAQTPTTPAQMHLGETTISQVNVLFVNPSVGNDKQGNGGESTPLKTITQALRVASPNTTIKLSKGTYSAETGEVFPLILKPGVSIQGDAGSRGRDVIVTGGGDYLSRSFGSKNIAIVSAKEAQLTGVTVTNSNPRGYGLWIESSGFTVTDSTFTGCTQDGIALSGNATATIRNNFFHRNGANGITLTGTSRGEVRDNVFKETGFGINIAQKAEPMVVGNQIQNNRSGIIVQASSRPVLRNNVIEGSKEDGLVAIAQAQPDLGNASEPGGNKFRNNARYDINASAAKQIIAAYGNTLASDRIAGKLDTKGATVAIARDLPSSSVPNNTAQETQTGQEITFSAPGVSNNNWQPLALTEMRTRKRVNTATPSRGGSRIVSASTLPPPPNPTYSAKNNTSGQSNNQLLPLQTTASGATSIKPKQSTQPVRSPFVATPPNLKQPTSRSAAGFPMPSSLVGKQTATGWQTVNTVNTSAPQVNYVQVAPNTVEFVAPRSQSLSTPVAPVPIANQRQPLPALKPAQVGSSALLPAGNTGNVPKVPLPENSAKTAYAGSSQIGLRFRVVAEVQTQRDQELVRFLAPGAFPTYWQGKAVMQAGVFSSRSNAEQMLNTLNNNGLRSTIEQVSN